MLPIFPYHFCFVDQISSYRSHNLRTGGISDYVDQERTPLNRILIEPPTAAHSAANSG